MQRCNRSELFYHCLFSFPFLSLFSFFFFFFFFLLQALCWYDLAFDFITLRKKIFIHVMQEFRHIDNFSLSTTRLYILMVSWGDCILFVKDLAPILRIETVLLP